MPGVLSAEILDRSHRGAVKEELQWCLKQSRAPRLRGLARFAEEEIVLPDGPWKDWRYRVDRQPYTGLFFSAVSSGRWKRVCATGPTQSGKTLTCFILPVLYHLFEIGENVICGVPDMDMACDKWRENLLPVIDTCRFREWLPTSGSGSRGGKFDSVKFRNGSTLKFMTGGSGEAGRAGFTSRVVVITETDTMEQAGEKSVQADKITQLEGRTLAYRNRMLYMECITMAEQGRTWREYVGGTESRIAVKCPLPGCGAWVSPEREALQGWQTAGDAVEAGEKAHWGCPACGGKWTEGERIAANRQAILCHRGQTIEAIESPGQRTLRIQGAVPRTDTLGFRWNAFNNLLMATADIGIEEWKAARAEDEENAEKGMLMQYWTRPVRPRPEDLLGLERHFICQRVSRWARGVVPPGTVWVTSALDPGKYTAWWSTVAWDRAGNGHVVDYGAIDVASEHLGPEIAVPKSMHEFRDMVEGGWEEGRVEGIATENTKNTKRRAPDRVWIDSGNWTDLVYGFVREVGGRYQAMKGMGSSNPMMSRYTQPKKVGPGVIFLGEEYHVTLMKGLGVALFEVNGDYWKTWLFSRLTCPVDAVGRMVLFYAIPKEHETFARHLCAERQVREFQLGKGEVVKWQVVNRKNHFLDTMYMNCAAAHFCGVRLGGEKKRQPQRTQRTEREEKAEEKNRFRTPDGRPYLVTER